MQGISGTRVVGGESMPFRAFLSLYGVAVFFVILLSIQDCVTTKWNLSHQSQVSPVGLHFLHYLAASLVLVPLLLLPRILRKFDQPHLRCFGTALSFWYATILSYLATSQGGLSLYYFEYQVTILGLLLLFGGLLAVIDGLYASSNIPASPAREEQKTWWKSLSFLVPIIIASVIVALMVTAAITSIFAPIPEAVTVEDKVLYHSARVVEIGDGRL